MSENGKGAATAAPALRIDGNATMAQIDEAEPRAWQAIRDVDDPDQAERLLQQVTVAEQAIRVMKISADREQRWAALRLRAERRWGELLGPPEDKGGRRTVSGTNGSVRFAHNQARRVAAVPLAAFDAYLAEAEKPSRTGLFRETTDKPKQAKRKTAQVEPVAALDQLKKRSKDVRKLPSDSRPRWTEKDCDLVDTVLGSLLKRRPKYAGRRLRELGAKRRGNPTALADLQYKMMQLTSILESVDVADVQVADTDDVGEFHDDLVEVQLWVDRSLAIASARLDDAALKRKIEKLRNNVGRSEPERRTAEALAAKLERRRRESRLD
jgi:hypothetical protein